MDNSDDYFEDDIVFDDEALAALDAEESKFMASQAQTTSNQRAPPLQYARPTLPPQPPAKRQKTATGWRAPIQAQPQAQAQFRPSVAPAPAAYSLEDLDLPEISVRNGFYGVQRESSQDQAQKAGGDGGGGGGGGMKRSASNLSAGSSGSAQQASGSGGRTASGGSTGAGGTSSKANGLQRSRSGLQVIGSYIPQAPANVPSRHTHNHNYNPNSSRQPLPLVNAHPPPQQHYAPQPQQPQQRPPIDRNTSYPGSGGAGSGPRLSQGLARNASNPSFNGRLAGPGQQPQRQSPGLSHAPPPAASQKETDARKLEEELAAMRAQLDAVGSISCPFMIMHPINIISIARIASTVEFGDANVAERSSQC